MQRNSAYQITLTKEEYRSADYMTARGYLGELTDHCSEEWSDDGSSVVLHITEPEAWEIQQVCDEDPHAVWALTTPSTSLGQKFSAFIESIV